MTRACIDDLAHTNGVTPQHPAFAQMQAWLQQQPQKVQFIAAEFNYGLSMRFADGRYFVCGYIEDGVLVSPLCPQCHGDDAAAQHPGVLMLDPAKLREFVARH